MRSIKFKSVISVQSEDPNYPASNLLNVDTFRKWMCRCGADGKPLNGSQNTVILQLDEPSEIVSIDIGNSGSAFVEIFAGTACEPDKFEVLLPASMLMSPADSRNQLNVNKVRMFEEKDLSCGGHKWDRIKIICSQNFNKNCAFGIAFIKLMSRGNEENETGLGKILKRSEVSASSFISEKPQQQQEEHHEIPPVKLARIEEQRRPFCEIMKGVLISLSGYENPYRSEIRDKAIEMGAQYSPKWTRQCTHLICAFPNTPKYEDAKRAKKIIVSEKWILDSYDSGKQLDPSPGYVVEKAKKPTGDKERNIVWCSRAGKTGLHFQLVISASIAQKLPNALSDERIYVADDVSDLDKNDCRRLIIAFGGTVDERIGPQTTTIISETGRLNEDVYDHWQTIPIVTLSWLQECHDTELKPAKHQFKPSLQ